MSLKNNSSLFLYGLHIFLTVVFSIWPFFLMQNKLILFQLELSVIFPNSLPWILSNLYLSRTTKRVCSLCSFTQPSGTDYKVIRFCLECHVVNLCNSYTFFTVYCMRTHCPFEYNSHFCIYRCGGGLLFFISNHFTHLER